MTARYDLLYDTHAALHLVDGELHELVGSTAAAPMPAEAQPGASAVPTMLERAHDEIRAVLANLRQSRDALQTVAVEKIQHTNEKLNEVTSTTESAATSILDALDRAGAMVDDLDVAEQTDDKARARATRERLRDEIFGMMGALQFQDITSQQLAYAASVLADVEARLLQMAGLFDPTAVFAQATVAPDPRTFDPRATTRNAEQRQAAADAVFAAGDAIAR